MSNEPDESVNEVKNIGDAVVDLETEQGFTPGPWEVWQGAYNITSDLSVWPTRANRDGEKRIACWIRTAANARLIAAAPALYDAARFARSVLAANPMEMSEQMALEKLDAALALVNESAKRSISDRGNPGQASRSKSESV